MKTNGVVFRPWRPSSATWALLEEVVQIIRSYRQKGYMVTLRQLYYRLVAAGTIANSLREYSRLSTILNNARLAGMLPWDIIEDRMRIPKKHSEFDGYEDITSSASMSYRLDRWAGQDRRPEVWSEKDAISSILSRVTNEMHIVLSVNRGYASVTAIHNAACRFKRSYDQGQTPVVLYFGDHDPSGLDMIRDITDRLDMFASQMDFDFEVQPIALTWEQIEEFKPPENPTKLKDSRAKKYISNYGRSSWEVDALPPDELHRLVEANIKNQLTDMKDYHKIIEIEKHDKEKLQDMAAEFVDKNDHGGLIGASERNER